MKERLTGAIILVALIVLLVPELLSGPTRSAPRAAVPSSSTEEPPLRSYTINLAEDARSRGAAPQSSGPQQPAPLPTAVSPADAAAPAAAAMSGPARDSTPAPAASPATPAPAATTADAAGTTAASPPATDGDAFMVQLGSFASRVNAERLARQVRAQGFQASVSQGSSGRHLYRVRVGPAHDLAAATDLVQQLHTAGHGGAIVPQ